jgi:hypothetical protein
VNADPFPDSRPLGDLTAAGIGTVDLTRTPSWRFAGLTDVWLLAVMPDGSLCEGTGPTTEDAIADARKRWRRWKRAHAGPLAVDGRAYRRRLRNRRRSQR